MKHSVFLPTKSDETNESILGIQMCKLPVNKLDTYKQNELRLTGLYIV